ncbi:MAG: ABC transporter permease [Cyanobacteria bacterium P01_F01_bin.153]
MTLTPFDLVITLGFLGLTIALSTALGLGLTRQWLTAGVRTTLQLGGLGYLLAIAGDGQSILWALVVTAAVIALGSFNIYKQVQGLPRWVYGAITVGLGGAVALSTTVIVGVILGPPQWDFPVLWFAVSAAIATPASHGTAQTALILNQALARQQRQKESQPSPVINQPATQSSNDPPSRDWVDDWDWGNDGTSDESSEGPSTAPPHLTESDRRRQAIRQGVTPILNGLLTAGIATIPLFLSGQLLGQIPPLTAVSLQITTLFASAFSTLIGAGTAAHVVAITYQKL